MHDETISIIDLAALRLTQAIDAQGIDLKPYLEPGELETARAAVIRLRRALLGLQMGPLYDPGWEVPVELLENVPVIEAAARVAKMKGEKAA